MIKKRVVKFHEAIFSDLVNFFVDCRVYFENMIYLGHLGPAEMSKIKNLQK